MVSHNYKVIDNFLSTDQFKEIKKIILSPFFPWFYQTNINHSSKPSDNDCYFTNLIINNSLVNNQDTYSLVSPILNKLDIKSIIRIKANLYPSTDKIKIHPPHVDYSFEHKAAIFYLNTNNGKTIIDNTVEIDSIENRLLLFEGFKNHSSTSCTDVDCRVNINFNYF